MILAKNYLEVYPYDKWTDKVKTTLILVLIIISAYYYIIALYFIIEHSSLHHWPEVHA